MIRSKPYMREGKPECEEPPESSPRIVETGSIGFIPGQGWFRYAVDGTRTPIEPPADEILGKPLMDVLRNPKTYNGIVAATPEHGAYAYSFSPGFFDLISEEPMRPLNDDTRAKINHDAHRNATGEALNKGHVSVGALVHLIWPALNGLAVEYLADNVTPTAESIFADGAKFLAAQAVKQAIDAKPNPDAPKSLDSPPATDKKGTAVGAPVLPVKGVAVSKADKTS